MQRHQAEVVSGVVDIRDAHQFDDGVIGAYRRFGVVRRNEIFVPLEVEVMLHEGCLLGRIRVRANRRLWQS